MRVLFVCMGNICRSPLAEGVLRHQLAQAGVEGVVVDSAGTDAWHVGEPPDPRSTEVAELHGVSLQGQRARRVAPADFEEFDMVVAMDDDNLSRLRQECPAEHQDKLCRMRDFDPQGDGDVPDPYYGGPAGFTVVYEMVERSCTTLLERLQK